MRYTILPARILFAAIFITAGIGHFSTETIAHAAAAGVPLAKLSVPLSGLMALVGGLAIALGYHAKVGAWLLVAFLVPVTLKMHAFWAITDPVMQQMQKVMFMKNLALLGGALAFAHFGAGALSVDARRNDRSPKLARAAT